MKKNHKNTRLLFFSITAIFAVIIGFLLFSCASGPESNVTELENKGTILGIPAPYWVRIYLEKGVSGLQALPEFRDKYCIVGEERGVNRQFVISWADAASAAQRIASLVRTNIASRYNTAVLAENSVQYQQEINNVLNAVSNVSFSGAQREADWWSLRRRYDPDNREIFTDEYTAWVLYTIPREELNRQIAFAMETGVSGDSALYDVTIALARDILLQGYDINELQSAAAIQQAASSNYDPPGSIVANALDDLSLIEEYVLGRDVAATILSGYRLYAANPALTAYLNKICNALVINSPRPAAFNGYHVAILDSDEINAFASPGGHIFLTRGIIAAAGSEDALAAVIAHELAHIQLRHGLRAIRANRDIEEWISRFYFSGAGIIAERMNNGFSHAQEFDADIAALSLLAVTGYNTQGLIDMLLELEKIQGAVRGGFNSTHPSPSSRLVNARVAAARYPDFPDNSQTRQQRFREIRR